MKKRILVTGGAGYIGDAVVKYLQDDGHGVTVLDNLTYGGAYMRNVRFVRGDVTDYRLMDSLLKKHGGFDSVVHLAAIVGDGACSVNPQRTTEVNERAVKKLAEMCSKTKTRLVFASTCSVYGANNDILDEDSPTNPLSLYAGTKLNAEKYIQDIMDDYVIFRLGTLFGMSSEHARIRCDLVANILTYRAAQGQHLTVFGGDQWRPMLHVQNAAWEFGNAATQKKYTGLYVLSCQNLTILDLARKIIDIVGNGEISLTPSKFEDQRNYRVKSKRNLIGHIPIERGIVEMAKVIKEGRIADVWSPEFHNAKYITAQNN